MMNDLRLNISRVRWDSTWVKTGKFSGYWSHTRTDERLASAKFRRWRNEDGNYYAKDHLACPPFFWRGSIRMTPTEAGKESNKCPPPSGQALDETGNVVSGQDYFAFGEIMRSYNNASVNDKYKFTEKERDTETNYDYFGARYYDSEIGRWLQVDPLGEIQQGWTPYHYAYNNPIVFTDPTGMLPKFDTAEELYDWLWARDNGDSGGGDEKKGGNRKESNDDKGKEKGNKDTEIALTANTIIGLSYTAKTEYLLKHQELFTNSKGINFTKSAIGPFKIFGGITSTIAASYYLVKAYNSKNQSNKIGYGIDAIMSGAGYFWPYGTIGSTAYFLIKSVNKSFVHSQPQDFFIPDKTRAK